MGKEIIAAPAEETADSVMVRDNMNVIYLEALQQVDVSEILAVCEVEARNAKPFTTAVLTDSEAGKLKDLGYVVYELGVGDGTHRIQWGAL